VEWKMKAWINGEFVGWDKANVSLLSHSFGRGSAIFEVLDIVPAKNGAAYFGLKEHIDRLFNSAKLIYMDIPLSKDEIAEAFIKTAKENSVKEGAAKLFCYFPSIEFSPIPKNPQVEIAVFCVDFAVFNIRQDVLSAPVSAGISVLKKLSPETVPVHAKVVGNYVNAYLAKMEVMKRGYEDVIMIDMKDSVAEGATSNVFFIRDGSMKTPLLDNALPGITRMAVMEVMEDAGIKVEETIIRSDEIPSFDEGFYAGSLVKIQPIQSIEKKMMGESCPGPVTIQVIEAMKKVYGGENKKFEKWLTYIE
jgi:branched-chain amino acid aminotransferase